MLFFCCLANKQKQCWKGKLNIYDEKMNEFSKNYTKAVPFARVLKESWAHKCLAALNILLHRLPSHIGGVACILQLTFFRQFCQSWTLFFFLEKFNSNTVAGGCHLRIKTRNRKHKLHKKISSRLYFYHEYFDNILYCFHNRTGNLAQLTEWSQHKKLDPSKKKFVGT